MEITIIRKARELTGVDKIRYLRRQHLEEQKPKHHYSFNQLIKDFEPTIQRWVWKYGRSFSPEDIRAFVYEEYWIAWNKAENWDQFFAYTAKQPRWRLEKELQAIRSHGITWTSEKVPVKQNGEMDLRADPTNPPLNGEQLHFTKVIENKDTLDWARNMQPDEQHRQVFDLLRDPVGWTHKEIAEKLGLTEGRISQIAGVVERPLRPRKIAAE